MYVFYAMISATMRLRRSLDIRKYMSKKKNKNVKDSPSIVVAEFLNGRGQEWTFGT